MICSASAYQYIEYNYGFEILLTLSSMGTIVKSCAKDNSQGLTFEQLPIVSCTGNYVFQSTLFSVHISTRCWITTPYAVGCTGTMGKLLHVLQWEKIFLGNCLQPAHSFMWFFNLHKELWAGFGYTLHEQLVTSDYECLAYSFLDSCTSLCRICVLCISYKTYYYICMII